MLAALAARAEGRTVIRDAQELKDKDTDRIATTVAALRPFGVQIEGREDGFVIEPSELSSAKSLVLPPDHRVIFAAMTLASSLEEPTTMSGWEKVSVSFPGCLELLGQLASVSHFEASVRRRSSSDGGGQDDHHHRRRRSSRTVRGALVGEAGNSSRSHRSGCGKAGQIAAPTLPRAWCRV